MGIRGLFQESPRKVIGIGDEHLHTYYFSAIVQFHNESMLLEMIASTPTCTGTNVV